MFILTSDNIFDLPTHFRHFKIGPQIMKNWEICVSVQFFHRSVNCKNLQKIFLSSLICPLQMTNWQWTPIIATLHAVNAHFIRCPSKKFLFWQLIFLRTVDPKNYEKIFFSSLICPLKVTNDIESLSLTLHGCKRALYQVTPQWSNPVNRP